MHNAEKITVEDLIREPHLFLELYNDFQALPPPPKPTIFDILNIGDKENVISDLLAFLLNPDMAHNLGGLWIDSLLDQYISIALPDTAIENKIYERGRFIKIEREYSTKKGRIDLLIEYENLCIVIENKIYHDPINDFVEYEKFVEKEFPSKERIYILLTIKPENNQSNFKNITYKSFINSVKQFIGDRFADSEPSILLLIKDFIYNLNNLVGENVSMEAADFYLKYFKLIYSLKDNLEEFQKNQLQLILNKLFDKVQDYLNNDEDFKEIGQWKKLDEGKATYKIIKSEKYDKYKLFDFDLTNLLKKNSYLIQISLSSEFTKDPNRKDKLREFCRDNENSLFTKFEAKGIKDPGYKNHIFIRKEYQIHSHNVLKLDGIIIKNLEEDWKPLLNEIRLIMDKVTELHSSEN